MPEFEIEGWSISQNNFGKVVLGGGMMSRDDRGARERKSGVCLV